MVSSSALSPGSSTPKNKGFGLKSSCFMMLAVSMAVTAASEPLFPALPPADPQKKKDGISQSAKRPRGGGGGGGVVKNGDWLTGRTCSVKGLLHGVAGKDAEYAGDAGVETGGERAIRCSASDGIVVCRCAPNDGAYAQNGVELVRRCHLLGDEGNLKRSGNPNNLREEAVEGKENGDLSENVVETSSRTLPGILPVSKSRPSPVRRISLSHTHSLTCMSPASTPYRSKVSIAPSSSGLVMRSLNLATTIPILSPVPSSDPTCSTTSSVARGGDRTPLRRPRRDGAPCPLDAVKFARNALRLPVLSRAPTERERQATRPGSPRARVAMLAPFASNFCIFFVYLILNRQQAPPHLFDALVQDEREKAPLGRRL